MRAEQQVLCGGSVGGPLRLEPGSTRSLDARRLAHGTPAPTHSPARVPRRPERLAGIDEAILDELEALGGAHRLCAWMFEGFADQVPGAAVLEMGAADMLLVEPDPLCAECARTNLRIRAARSDHQGFAA